MTAVVRVLAPYVLGVAAVTAWQRAFDRLPLAASMLVLLLSVALVGAWVTVRCLLDDRRLGGRGQAGLLDHAIETGDVRRGADVATWSERLPALLDRAQADARAATWMWLPATAAAATLLAVALLGDPRVALGQVLVPVALLVLWPLQLRRLRHRAAGLRRLLDLLAAEHGPLAPPAPAARAGTRRA